MLQHIKNVFVLCSLFLIILFSVDSFSYALSIFHKREAFFIGVTSLISFIGSIICIGFIVLMVFHNIKKQKPQTIHIPTNPFFFKSEDDNPYRSPCE